MTQPKRSVPPKRDENTQSTTRGTVTERPAAGVTATDAASVTVRTQNVSPRVSAALAYVAQGWSVFPALAKGKRPAGLLVPNGLRDATQDAAKIAEWWRVYPTANIAATPPAGHWVLDIDVYKNAALQPLIDRLADLHTPMQRSGGGGVHFVFAGLPPNARDLKRLYGIGIDVKASGKGYVLVAPSVHPDTGAFYEWGKSFTIKAAANPEWLAAAATRKDEPDDGQSSSKQPLGLTLDQVFVVLEKLAQEWRDDYNLCVRAGMACHHETGGSAEGLAVWESVCRRSDNWEEGWCAEKWPTFGPLLGGRELTMRSLRSEVPHVFASFEFEPVPEPEPDAKIDDASDVFERPRMRLYNPLRDAPKQQHYMLRGPVWLPDEPESVVFFGQSDTFKSVSVQAFCVYMAAGVSLDHKAVPPRVVVYAAEEAPMLWDNNLHAWRVHFKKVLAPDVFEHAMRNLLPEDPSLGYLQRIDGSIGGLSSVRAEDLADLALEQKRRLGTDARAVVVLDPIAEVLEGDESSAVEMRKYIAAGRVVQRRADALVLHVHHTGHSATDRERGSSTLGAAQFARYQLKRKAGATELELHCAKHKAGKGRTPSLWRMHLLVLSAGLELDPPTGVVLELLGDVPPPPTEAEVSAARSTDMATMLGAYARDPSIGRPRLQRELANASASQVDALREQAVVRGLLARVTKGEGASRAGYALTPAGRALAAISPPDEADDLLG